MMDPVDRIDAERNEGIAEEEQTSVWHFPRNEKGEFAKFNIGDAIVEFYAPLIYRTDESGDIVMTTDGTEYSFDKEPGTYTRGKEYKGE